jgi:hypothetical protein
MRTALLGMVVVLAAGCGGTKTVTVTKTVAGPSSSQNVRIFGHIASLKRSGNRYVMRFDPAWFLTGVTANTAAHEDGTVPPNEPVPNDNYVVDESHRLYTYFVAPSANVTVLTPQANVIGSPITVAQLAELVAGKKPVKLFEGLDTGFWVTVHVDTATSLAQQYHP